MDVLGKRKLTRGDPKIRAAVESSLAKGPKRCGEIADEVRVSMSTVLRYIDLMKDEKAVYISGWTPNKNPIYALGDKPDVPKPPKMSHKEVSKRYWDNLKANPEAHKKRLKQHAKYMRRRRREDPLWALEDSIRKKKDYLKKKTTVPVDPFAQQFAGLFKRGE